MNIAPYPGENSNPAVARGGELRTMAPVEHGESPVHRPTHKSWIYSLTLVCFLFGGALALQLRAMNQVRVNDQRKAEGQIQAQARVAVMQHQVAREIRAKRDLQSRLAQLQVALKDGAVGSRQKAEELNTRINELQLVAGLTPVSGPGVRVTLNDNHSVTPGGDASSLVPGIVHDFDVLQIVNELRATKAEAIAVNGTRITGYTPIRCVGPTILINWEPQPAPFHIEAVGEPAGLESALRLPGGILDRLKTDAMLKVDVERVRNLRLPAAETLPHLKVAKANQGSRG